MHNSSCFSFQFYIKPQPTMRGCTAMHSCFSFQFYIKPQLVLPATSIVSCCFSFQFYIKPQRKRQDDAGKGVVSHSNSTSNHNSVLRRTLPHYVVSHSILHQTTTYMWLLSREKDVVSHSNSTSNHNTLYKSAVRNMLFLIPILHQTTTSTAMTMCIFRCFSFQFYIKPQQNVEGSANSISCFSFQFYIKPQLL